MTSKAAGSREKSPKAKQKGEGRRIESAVEARTPSNPLREPSPNPVVTIARTAFTEVFKASRKGSAIAIKVCRKPSLKDSANTWRNELDILTELDHSSVVNLVTYDALILSLELEYVGPDLAQSADEHQLSNLPEDKQYRVWLDVARAIEYIHAERIVHRDIKPQNILLGRGDRGAVICDFGMSVRVYQKPKTCNGGTPCYVPPEYLIDSPRGFEGDIWAFGITMLFVFGLIPLPMGNWKIAAVEHDLDVRQKMIDWVNNILRVTKAVPKTLLPLRAMLAKVPHERITAAALAKDPLLQPLGRGLPA